MALVPLSGGKSKEPQSGCARKCHSLQTAFPCRCDSTRLAGVQRCRSVQIQREHPHIPGAQRQGRAQRAVQHRVPAALTAPPAPAQAVEAPSPYPGDGLTPGAGGILLPPAVTVSHTQEPHTPCPGSPQMQRMRIE